jgi:hypothetical protein
VSHGRPYWQGCVLCQNSVSVSIALTPDLRVWGTLSNRPHGHPHEPAACWRAPRLEPFLSNSTVLHCLYCTVFAPCRFTGADEAAALAEKAHNLFAKDCKVKCGIKVRPWYLEGAQLLANCLHHDRSLWTTDHDMLTTVNDWSILPGRFPECAG